MHSGDDNYVDEKRANSVVMLTYYAYRIAGNFHFKNFVVQTKFVKYIANLKVLHGYCP